MSLVSILQFNIRGSDVYKKYYTSYFYEINLISTCMNFSHLEFILKIFE